MGKTGIQFIGKECGFLVKLYRVLTEEIAKDNYLTSIFFEKDSATISKAVANTAKDAEIGGRINLSE